MQKIVLKNACKANWEKMTPNERGRHCKSCSKTVYDVTAMSNTEVLNKYEELNGNMCLRIPVDRAVITSQPRYSQWKAAIVTFLLTCWLSAQQIVARAQSKTKDHIQDESKKIFEKCIVTGQVLDSLNNGNPIAFARIELMIGDLSYYNVFTDSIGKFEINIKKELSIKDTLTIKCAAIGYEPVTRQSTVRDSIKADIFLEENHVCLNEVVIKSRKESVIMGGMAGDTFMGIPVKPSRNRKVYRARHEWGTGTRTYHSEEIERFNLGR